LWWFPYGSQARELFDTALQALYAPSFLKRVSLVELVKNIDRLF
jgi:hypothetical protein